MIKLTLRLKNTQMEEFTFEKGKIDVGRSPENDIPIDNMAVSRKHAQIELLEGRGYVLRDLHSSNGTFLNGAQIDAQDHPLQDGDIIGVGKFEIQVKGPGKTTQPSAKMAPIEPEGTVIFDAARHKPAPQAEASAPKAAHSPSVSAVKGPLQGKEFKITKEVTTLGNGPGDDIPAEGWFISSPQAKIHRQGDRFYITHTGGFFSTTKVNGSKIEKDHILKNKDEISIGRCTYLFNQ